MKKNIILELYKKDQSVFTFKEIAIFFPEIKLQSLKDKLKYAVKKGEIIRPRKGLYTKLKYNTHELANKIYTPSYISYETVLKEKGVIFQETKIITVASYLTREIYVNNITISYRKIKNVVLNNLEGVENRKAYFIASLERAFLDSVFLFKDYHFDNLKPIDWNKVFSLLTIYQTKTLQKRVKEYYQIYKEEYAG